MKKFFYKRIFVYCFLLLFLSSCTRDQAIDEKLLEKADDIYRIPTVTEADEYMGDYAPEAEYSAGDLSSINGIHYNSAYSAALADGKYYFDVKTFQTRTNEDGSKNYGTATITRSMNLETGESFYLCPDPLCEHSNRGKYADFSCCKCGAACRILYCCV